MTHTTTLPSIYLMLIGLLLVTATPSTAQETGQPMVKFGMTGYGHLATMSAVSRDLLANGFEPLDKQGSYFEVYIKNSKPNNRWTGAYSLSYYERKADTRPTSFADISRADIVGYGINFGIEYELVNTKYFNVAPIITQHLEYFNMTIVEGLNGTSLGSILSSDVSSYSINRLQAPISVGLIAGVKIPTNQAFLSLDWIGINLTAGYKLHTENAWNLAGTVPMSTDIDLSSVFVGVGLELGIFGKVEE